MTKDLINRITYYLSSGGLFNPELADHLAVRNLLMECREALAQRTWVGLTPEQAVDLYKATETDNRMVLIDAIEAKLKEKNGLHRQHVIDGSPCWCEPETSYTDPETGASVVVHKEPQ